MHKYTGGGLSYPPALLSLPLFSHLHLSFPCLSSPIFTSPSPIFSSPFLSFPLLFSPFLPVLHGQAGWLSVIILPVLLLLLLHGTDDSIIARQRQVGLWIKVALRYRSGISFCSLNPTRRYERWNCPSP